MRNFRHGGDHSRPSLDETTAEQGNADAAIRTPVAIIIDASDAVSPLPHGVARQRPRASGFR